MMLDTPRGAHPAAGRRAGETMMEEPYEYMKKAEQYRPSMWAKGVALLEATETALAAGREIPVEKVGDMLSTFPDDHRAFLMRALSLMCTTHEGGLKMGDGALNGNRLHTGYVSFFGTKPENTWDKWESLILEVADDPA